MARTIVVTGAASGIGKATSELLSSRGDTVIGVDLQGTDINVETSKGDVMLSGFVESQAQIDKAATLARSVDGVKQVSNKLEVKK